MHLPHALGAMLMGGRVARLCAGLPRGGGGGGAALHRLPPLRAPAPSPSSPSQQQQQQPCGRWRAAASAAGPTSSNGAARPAGAGAAAAAAARVGRIELVIGPMFAGKTSELLRRVAAAEAAGARVAVVKSDRDGRYAADAVATHDGGRRAAHAAPTLAAFRAALGPAAYAALDVVAVDEAQFFPDLAAFAAAAADGDGKRLVLAGLDGDFRRRAFGQVLDLVPLADSVTRLSAACAMCRAEAGAAAGTAAAPDVPALFSLRLRRAAAAAGGEEAQELVGGAEAYAPVCRRHYVQHMGAAAHP